MKKYHKKPCLKPSKIYGRTLKNILTNLIIVENYAPISTEFYNNYVMPITYINHIIYYTYPDLPLEY